MNINRSVLILGIARMADAMGNSFLIVVLPLYIASQSVSGNDFGLTTSFITGLVLGLFGLISSIAQPFVGRLSDKVGKRKLFVAGGLLFFAIANASYTWADTYFSIFLVRSAQGLAAALTITCSVALVSEVSNKGNRGNNMGTYNTLRLIGFGGGPLLSGLLLKHAPYHLPMIGSIDGFTTTFIIASLGAFASMVLVALFVQDQNTQKSNEPLIFKILAKKNGQWLDPIFALGVATFVMSFGFSLLSPIEIETNQRLSQGAFMFSVEFSAMLGALAIFQPLVGKASDKYGRRIFILVGLICLIPFTLFQGLATESWHLIVFRALQGISAAMVFSPALALAGDLAEKGQTGARLAVVTMAFGLGISMGSFLSGYAVRYGYITPFIIGAIMAGIGSIIVATQVPKSKGDKEESLGINN